MHKLVAVVDGVLLTANEAVIVRPPVDRSFICLLVLVSMNRNEWHSVTAAQDWPHGQRDNGPVPQRYIGERCRFLVSVGGNKHTINLRYHDVHFIMCLQIPCQPASMCSDSEALALVRTFTRSDAGTPTLVLSSSVDSHNIRKKKNGWQDRKYFVSIQCK